MTDHITYLDVETTGLYPTSDRVVQISVKNRQSILKLTINPQIPIPKEASDVHRILDADVAGKPTFANIYQSLLPYFDTNNCKYICGYNVAFDFKFMQSEFSRVGLFLESKNYMFLDPLAIHKKLCPNDLASMYRRYTGKELQGGHDAEVDMTACMEILAEQSRRTKKDIDGLAQLSGYANKTIGGWLELTPTGYILLMGKYQGQYLQDVANKAPDYINWLLSAKDTSFEELLIFKEYSR